MTDVDEFLHISCENPKVVQIKINGEIFFSKHTHSVNQIWFRMDILSKNDEQN